MSLSTWRILALLVVVAAISSGSLAQAPTTVPVITKSTQETLPKEWLQDPIKGLAEDVAETEVARSQQAVTKMLAKYPPAILTRNLRRIVFVSKLQFYGLDYGGTNSSDTVYICNQGVSKGFTDLYLEASLHHEFSSILLRNYTAQFPGTEWTDALPAKFKYRGDGVQSLREGTSSTQAADKYLKDGFIAEYSTSSLEEDFNMLAESLFTGGKEFWIWYDKYPALRRKADLVMAFYGNLDPWFTQEKFRSFAKNP